MDGAVRGIAADTGVRSPALADAPYDDGLVKLLDPTLHQISPRHLELFWRYQIVRTSVDFGAACCFVVGSIFFFYESMAIPACWLFLIGSILFAVKPSIDMVRSMHLKKLPAPQATEELTEEAAQEVVSG